MRVVYMYEQRCFLSFGTHSRRDACASECECLKSHAVGLGVFLHQFYICKLISGAPRAPRSQQVYPVYPEIPFICLPSAKITDSSKACTVFYTFNYMSCGPYTSTENTLHWAIFPTLSLLLLPGFGQFLFILGKERRKFQWNYWFLSAIKSL